MGEVNKYSMWKEVATYYILLVLRKFKERKDLIVCVVAQITKASRTQLHQVWHEILGRILIGRVYNIEESHSQRKKELE